MVEETPQAKEFVRLVRRLKTEVEQGLDGDNVRVFLTARGLGIVQEILDSVKAMRITRCGSMILMADAQAYEVCLRSFMSPEVTKRAALLVDLANMYAFDQDRVQQFVDSSALKELDPQELNLLKQARAEDKFLGLF